MITAIPLWKSAPVANVNKYQPNMPATASAMAKIAKPTVTPGQKMVAFPLRTPTNTMFLRCSSFMCFPLETPRNDANHVDGKSKKYHDQKKCSFLNSPSCDYSSSLSFWCFGFKMISGNFRAMKTSIRFCRSCFNSSQRAFKSRRVDFFSRFKKTARYCRSTWMSWISPIAFCCERSSRKNPGEIPCNKGLNASAVYLSRLTAILSRCIEAGSSDVV